jgi:uncharacterized protein (TIGR00645 family)
VNARNDVQGPRRPIPNALSAIIFSSRWLQAPIYLGLIVAQFIYVVVFVMDLVHLWELVMGGGELKESTIMLSVLGLIDVAMVANLLIMVIVGGYETFVSRVKTDGHPDEPEWLSHVNANVLKVKLAMAIIGISSIHLLQTFIGAGAIGRPSSHYTAEGVMWQVIIHLTFVVSAIALAVIDRMSYHKAHKGESHDGRAVQLPDVPDAPAQTEAAVSAREPATAR